MEGLIDNRNALPFMLAGKCEVTLKSIRTGKCLSFKIEKVESYKPGEEFIYFIKHVKGDESVYAGKLSFDSKLDKFVYSQGAKGHLAEHSVEIQGLMNVVNRLYNEDYDLPLEVYHCGRCGKCGKRLTTPDSILTGLGPICAKACGVPHPKNKRRG